MQQTGGLSVEEILESIKKVIARDNTEVAQVERTRRETEGVVYRNEPVDADFEPTADDEDSDFESNDNAVDPGEVLDLSRMFEEDDQSERGKAVALTDPTELQVPATESNSFEEFAEEEAPMIDPEPESSSSADIPEFAASQSSTDDQGASAAPKEHSSSQSETPLERMVREALRPLLTEWLDDNLPQIVERLVKAEIEHVLGKPR